MQEQQQAKGEIGQGQQPCPEIAAAPETAEGPRDGAEGPDAGQQQPGGEGLVVAQEGGEGRGETDEDAGLGEAIEYRVVAPEFQHQGVKDVGQGGGKGEGNAQRLVGQPRLVRQQIGAEEAGDAQPLQGIQGQVADVGQEDRAPGDQPVHQVEEQDGEDEAEVGAIGEITGAGVAGEGRRLPEFEHRDQGAAGVQAQEDLVAPGGQVQLEQGPAVIFLLRPLGQPIAAGTVVHLARRVEVIEVDVVQVGRHDLQPPQGGVVGLTQQGEMQPDGLGYVARA